MESNKGLTTLPVDNDFVYKVNTLWHKHGNRFGDKNRTWLNELYKRLHRKGQPRVHIKTVDKVNQMYEEKENE